MKTVYTNYEDGRSSISDDGYGCRIDIPMWQWLLFRVYRRLDRAVHAWEKRLDTAAYNASYDAMTTQEKNRCEQHIWPVAIDDVNSGEKL